MPDDHARQTLADRYAEREIGRLEGQPWRSARPRPGIDGLTLIAWRLAGFYRCFHRWWEQESPLNRALNACVRLLRVDIRTLKAAKLLFCGQFGSSPTATLRRRDRL